MCKEGAHASSLVIGYTPCSRQALQIGEKKQEHKVLSLELGKQAFFDEVWKADMWLVSLEDYPTCVENYTGLVVYIVKSGAFIPCPVSYALVDIGLGSLVELGYDVPRGLSCGSVVCASRLC